MIKKIILFVLFFSFYCFSNGQNVRLMTYNIRYDNPGDKENRWDLRKEFLTAQIKFYEPDVIGIQEGLDHQVKYMNKSLDQYDFTGVGRNDGNTKGEYSGIFYKSDKYKIIKSSTFWLSDTPEKISRGWDAALERICTYALFEEKFSKQKFWFFNTHFDHRGEKARKNSAKLIISKIKEINKENYPVILTGDFNLKPDENPIQYITKYMIDSKESASVVSFGPEGTFNGFNYNYTDSKRIDYIFLSRTGIKVKKYSVLTDSKNHRFPSDHFPVFVEIILQD